MTAKFNPMNRRKFLSSSAQAAAGIVAAGKLASYAEEKCVAKAKAKCANDTINMAAIGIKGRGGGLIQNFAKMKNVNMKILCDVDENLFADRVKKIEEIQGFAPATETDLRKVYDNKDIDAVVIATPNHWHALATIWACQAGKHVYCEKPSCHNVWEGRKMVEVARKYNRVVQVGFQNRSIGNVMAAMKALREGVIGDVYMAKGLCYKPRHSFGLFPDSKVPAGVHYDLWLGPAPYRPFNKGRFHYNWHWHWATGNGDIGNQGPHQFDVARWGINKNDHPVKVRSFGGYYKYGKVCSQETANTQTAVFEYADGKILQFEVRGLYTNGESTIASGMATEKQQDVKIGNLFFGTEGWMSVNGSTWKTFMGKKGEPGPSSTSVEPAADPMNLMGAGGEGNFSNFISAVRSGNPKDLNCDIEVGHMSSALPHLANISYRLGRGLKFNSKNEKFVGDKEADKMLTRKYRKPYVVPKNV